MIYPRTARSPGTSTTRVRSCRCTGSLGKHTGAVLLLTAAIEWLTQLHYLSCFEGRPRLDAFTKHIFKSHWLEESQHARLDHLETLRAFSDDDRIEKDQAIDDLIDLVGAVDGLLQQQARLDVDNLQACLWRQLGSGRAAGDPGRRARRQALHVHRERRHAPELPGAVRDGGDTRPGRRCSRPSAPCWHRRWRQADGAVGISRGPPVGETCRARPAARGRRPLLRRHPLPRPRQPPSPASQRSTAAACRASSASARACRVGPRPRHGRARGGPPPRRGSTAPTPRSPARRAAG